jgi:putative transposase
MLSYKAKFSGKEVVKVPKFYASSRICSNCGSKKDDLTLKMREWKCEFCGKIHDRDVNAAKNIKAEGQRSLILVK